MTSSDGAPRVIAVANQKGGVGKTTTAVNLAAGLGELGLAVAVLDVDSQCNATSGLGVDPDRVDLTAYEVLHPDRTRRVGLAEALVETETPGVRVLPGSEALADIDQHGAGPGGEQLLAHAIRRWDTGCDVVIIDCPPNLGRLTVTGLAAAHDLMIPVAPGPDELSALNRLLDTVDTIRQNGLNEAVQVGWVVITSYDGRNHLNRDVVRQLREGFEQYVGIIRHTVRVPEAKARRRPVLTCYPDSTAAQDYRALALNVRKGLGL